MGHRFVLWAAVSGLLAAPVLAGVVEDDLAVVKKAVSNEKALSREERPAPKADPPRARKGQEPRWLKLRIEDRGTKKGKLSLNLPLDLVRALDDEGEDWPVPWPHHKDGKGPQVRLGDVLRALRSGQEIVEIEDEDSTVRIWVE
jgi:hypothetical protein